MLDKVQSINKRSKSKVNTKRQQESPDNSSARCVANIDILKFSSIDKRILTNYLQ